MACWLGGEGVPLALSSCGKVTSYVVGNKNQLFHQSWDLAELFGKGISRGHRCCQSGMGAAGNPGREAAKVLGLLYVESPVGAGGR